MMHVTMILCDTLLIATRNAENQWVGTCQDNHAGKCESFVWSDDQFNSIVALALAGDDPLFSDEQKSRLYHHAESALTGWEPTVRPIP